MRGQSSAAAKQHHIRTISLQLLKCVWCIIAIVSSLRTSTQLQQELRMEQVPQVGDFLQIITPPFSESGILTVLSTRRRPETRRITDVQSNEDP